MSEENTVYDVVGIGNAIVVSITALSVASKGLSNRAFNSPTLAVASS